jgi:hypothetical protein
MALIVLVFTRFICSNILVWYAFLEFRDADLIISPGTTEYMTDSNSYPLRIDGLVPVSLDQ